MSTALQRYKQLVDELRGLSPTAEAQINDIDEQLKQAWADLCETERAEADLYWRQSITAQFPKPDGLN